MADLLPDTWRLEDDEVKCCHQRRTQRRTPVTDILIWIECYSSLVATLATKFPSQTPHFMAYMKTIVKAHRTFTGEGWVTYDTCFRRKAAVSRSTEWGHIDFTLYNETFTGRAKAVARCCHCSSDLHSSQDCSYSSGVPKSGGSWTRPIRSQPSAVYQLFNGRTGNRCTFNPCKYNHTCSDCRGRHPVASCRRGNRPPLEKVARLDTGRRNDLK